MKSPQCVIGVIGQEVIIALQNQKTHDMIFWKTDNLRAHNSVGKEKAFHVFE